MLSFMWCILSFWKLSFVLLCFACLDIIKNFQTSLPCFDLFASLTWFKHTIIIIVDISCKRNCRMVQNMNVSIKTAVNNWDAKLQWCNVHLYHNSWSHLPNCWPFSTQSLQTIIPMNDNPAQKYTQPIIHTNVYYFKLNCIFLNATFTTHTLIYPD